LCDVELFYLLFNASTEATSTIRSSWPPTAFFKPSSVRISLGSILYFSAILTTGLEKPENTPDIPLTIVMLSDFGKEPEKRFAASSAASKALYKLIFVG
jgi:hypothetical protein